MKPKLDASKDLKKIVSRLTQTTEKNFTNKLDEWYEIYKDFLEEKSISSTTGKLHYTHTRIRAEYRSLRTNLHYLLATKTIRIYLFQHNKCTRSWSVLSHEKYD